MYIYKYLVASLYGTKVGVPYAFGCILLSSLGVTLWSSPSLSVYRDLHFIFLQLQNIPLCGCTIVDSTRLSSVGPCLVIL